MSITPRRAASLLGAAALGVTAMTGVGSAAASTAQASAVRPSISRLSPSHEPAVGFPASFSDFQDFAYAYTVGS